MAFPAEYGGSKGVQSGKQSRHAVPYILKPLCLSAFQPVFHPYIQKIQKKQPKIS